MVLAKNLGNDLRAWVYTDRVKLPAYLHWLCVHRQSTPIRFKVIDLLEPPKASLLTYLERPHAQRTGTPAEGLHLLSSAGVSTLRKAKVNLTKGTEFERVLRACDEHPLVRAEVEKLKLPRASVVNDPWLYGTDRPDKNRRLYQCYMYIVLNDDPEANPYSIPVAFAPIFDAHTAELVEVEKLPRGVGTELDPDTMPWGAVAPVEYSERLLGKTYFRTDLKPLNVVQPDGPSFRMDGRQITWQKWSFHLGWTVREGPVLNNVSYDGRSLFHRVSMSEMTAFDLGDSGLGLTANTLTLGCDCLGHIAYFDGIHTTAAGEPIEMKNHTNMRNGQASMVRNRTLVIQCTATVLNYEYILAFVLDQAVNLHVEVRAMGIMSIMPIARNTVSPWGTVVAPGVLAVNHQHLFSLRAGPVLDGVRNTVVYRAARYDLNLPSARTYRIINPNRLNAVSGKPLYAAGEFTNQGTDDTGLGVWSQRAQPVENHDVVLWHTFGTTHITRPEDFAVMPVEKMAVSLKPTSLFELNPSNDVPRSRQAQSRSTLVEHASVAPASCGRCTL
ncbi:amine oxidase catalytic domain-containing protein [Aspergillus homomorphus CBS 101889]|uniref:Amine oxidase n=1 Tax=Aspergillus homomorphus (strain CBS 101889) TaxID=1450537 RepID=A0A395HKC6_ASPHC|nr:amine oxidase catalytic domain-containing protein [Aspergillus homomorphus CBS 101889]RAL07883.1 amine oxidase catalytic domain-containing protein [Aspergillus homomorphus CBS 101889]